MPSLSRHAVLRLWAGRGGTAVADQGLTALAGFAINVALARWLDPAAYGSFALGFAALLIASALHTALVLEPMSVLGPARHAARLPAYLEAQRRLHWRLTIPPALVLAAAGGIVALAGAPAHLAQALAGAGVATPFVLRFWLARREAYVRERPSGALGASAVYLGCVAAGIGVLGATGTASALTGFLVLAVAGAAVSTGARDAAGAAAWRPVLAEQWSYGRWMVAAQAITLAGTQAQIVVAAGLVGLAGAGALRAMQIAMLPMVQVVTAIATLALPALARDFGRGDTEVMRRKGFTVLVWLGAGALLYEAALLLFHHPIEQALFGGKFADLSWLIPVLGAVPVLTALTTGLSLMLRAAQRPSHYLVAAAVTGPVGIASAAGFTAAWGVAGAAASLVAANFVTLAVAIALYRRWIPRSRP